MLRGGSQTEQSDLINQRGINTDDVFNVTSVLNDERTDSSQEVAAAYSKCFLNSRQNSGSIIVRVITLNF